MGQSNYRYVARAFEGGWRLFDRKMQKWWGPKVKQYPQRIIDYLNQKKQGDRDGRKLGFMIQDYNK
jgi:hypothetical protein